MPRVRIAFLPAFDGSVNNQLGAVTKAAARVIQHICRALREDRVAPRHAVFECLLPELEVVLRWHAPRVADNGNFGEHRLPQPKHAIGDFVRVSRILLLDRHVDQIVRDAARRQVVINDLRQNQLRGYEENSLGGLDQVRVLHRRATDNRRGVNRVFAHGDGRHVKQRVLILQSVEPRVIPKWPFDNPRFIRVDVALQNKLCIRRNLETDRDALDDILALVAQKTRQAVLVDARHGRNRRGRRVDQRWVATNCHGDLEPLT